MRKLFIKPIYIVGLLLLASCVDDLTKLNTSPKSYTEVPGDMLYTNAVRELTDEVVYGATFKVLAQQWSETTYTDASRYNLPNIGNLFWNTLYRDVLRDLKEAKALITAETLSDPEVKQNRLALIDIMEVYTYSILVNTFGDVPYEEALDSDDLQPSYDDAEAIYADLFDRLDADLVTLKASSSDESMGSQDLIYAGSVAKWIKFATSLKLRMAMTLVEANVSSFSPKTKAEEAVASGDLFSSNDDNALFKYQSSPPNTNQIWVNLIQSGREDYVASNTMVGFMTPLADPRMAFYFTADKANGYSGGIFGNSNNYGNFSHAGELMTDQSFPGVLLDYTEVEFYLAEAAVRGYTGVGTAEEHYDNAIAASITYWGGTTDQVDTYLDQTGVDFASASGTGIQKIAFQKYLAMYNRGLEAWTEYRRLDYPVLNVVASPLDDFPVRYTYPVAEQNLNETNWKAASDAIGEDVVTTRVFWDTK